MTSKIAIAAAGSGRDPKDISLVAVTKMHPVETVRAAIIAGLCDFGENYAQEFDSKRRDLGEIPCASWHFIGHLQSNKASLVVGRASLIQSVDREKIARALGREATEQGIVQDVLIQVRLGDEESKSGVPVALAPALRDAILREPGLRLRGFMGIAPLLEADGQISRPRKYFDALKEVFESLRVEYCDILSIGMSDDYEEAIAAGSTMLRIGSALFGRRGT